MWPPIPGSLQLRLLVPLVLISRTAALYALPSSPCANQCGNVLGGTSGADIVCADSDYPTSGNPGSVVGIVFQGCVSCQINSNYTDVATNETDLQVGLYNLRYAMSWCLFGYPNNTNVMDTPCTTSHSCGPLEVGFVHDNLSIDTEAFGYCPDLPSNQAEACSTCIEQLSNEFYLSNFLTALTGACEQRPAQGSTISLDGSLFSKTSVNLTTPDTSPSSSFSHNGAGLNLEERVGIAAGAIVGFLIITGTCIICFGKRRRRRALLARQRSSGYAEWQKQQAMQTTQGPSGHGETSAISGSFFDSPQSQRPLYSQTWGGPSRQANMSVQQQEESPIERIYSPYSSHYSSPVSAQDGVAIKAQEWPYPVDPQAHQTQNQSPYQNEDRASGFGRGFSTDRKGSFSGMRQRSKEREREGEKIEMQNVPPVLMHPGHGRGNSLALTEDDYKSGNAL